MAQGSHPDKHAVGLGFPCTSHTNTDPVLAALPGCQQPLRTEGGVSGSLTSQLSPAARYLHSLSSCSWWKAERRLGLRVSLVASCQQSEIACEGREVGRKEHSYRRGEGNGNPASPPSPPAQGAPTSLVPCQPSLSPSSLCW